MRRSGRSNEPYVKPVTHIELSEKHLGLRFAAFLIFLVIGVGALAYGTLLLVRGADGWRTVEAGKIRDHIYDEEIVFEYNVTSSVEFRQLKSLYTSLLERVAPLFDAETGYEGVNNIYYINRHINEQIVVDELLYSAFEKINENGCRVVFTAPFYEEYRGAFFSPDDSTAALFDPDKNEDIKEMADRIAAFACDKNSVEIRLLGKNTVMLYVSEEYKKYVEEISGSSYIDLWLVKNAFIIDYCADVITGSGYKGGRIYSYDGYLRNFDPGTEYTYKIYDLLDNSEVISAEMVYDGVISAVTMRTFPVFRLDSSRMYMYSDGTRITDYLDAHTCNDKTFQPCYTVYSYGRKCSDIAFAALETYISDTGKLGLIERTDGMEYIFSKDLHVSYSEKDVRIDSYVNKPLYRSIFR